MKQTVLVGVTSGIAAYKTLELIKLLRKEKIEVFVIMTKTASKMVPAAEFAKVSGHKVFVELFEKGFNYRDVLKSRKVEHIELADKADVLVIAPATANVVGKLAHGIADDYLTTTALAVTAPMIICPAMNVHMWNNPFVQENIGKLRQAGYQIIGPTKGMLACGYEGKGRLVDVGLIKNEILKQLKRTSVLQDKKIIVTAGGTREKIDGIRYLTNRGSGKMGVAIAEECYLRGAKVLLLRAKHAVAPRYLINEELFTTADELFILIKKYIQDYDIIYHTAAVSDFQVREPITGKLSSKDVATITLTPRKKILDQLKTLNPHIFLVSFKAEYGLAEKELLRTAKERLKESRSDMIVANDVGRDDRGFEADTNEVWVISSKGSVKKIAFSAKRNIASELVDFLP